MQSQLPMVPEQASNFAPQVDALMVFIVAVCLFFAVAVTAAVIYFFFKYRRTRVSEIGVPIHGDMRLETAWIVVPLILAMGMFAWGAIVVRGLPAYSQRHAGHLCNRQAVDVEGAAAHRAEGNQRAARAHRDATCG